MTPMREFSPSFVFGTTTTVEALSPLMSRRMCTRGGVIMFAGRCR